VIQGDIALLKTYGLGPYTTAIKKVEEDIKALQVRHHTQAYHTHRHGAPAPTTRVPHRVLWCGEAGWWLTSPLHLCTLPASMASQDKVKELIGIKESDTGLSLPSQWDLVSDKQMMQEEQPLQVRACGRLTLTRRFYCPPAPRHTLQGRSMLLGPFYVHCDRVIGSDRATHTSHLVQVARCTKIINPGQEVGLPFNPLYHSLMNIQ
jgi:hypothetical protein